MFLCKFHKYNFFSVLNVHKPNRLFHISHNNHIRKLVFKHSQDQTKNENLEKPLGSFLIEQNNNNFFGIESDEGVYFVDPLENRSEALSKQSHVLNVKQKFHRATFGVIRQDSDNKLNVHGQFENTDYEFPYKSTDFSDVSGKHLKINNDIFSVLYRKSSYNDKLESNYNECSSSDELFSDISKSEMEGSNNNHPQSSRNEHSKETQDMSYIDECFFDGVNEKNSNESSVLNKKSVEELSYLDASIFGEDINSKNRFSGESNSDQNSIENVKFLSKEQNLNVLLKGENVNSTKYLNEHKSTKYPSERSSFVKVTTESKTVNSNVVKNEIKEAIINTNNLHQHSKIKYFQDSEPEYLPGTDLYTTVKKNFIYKTDAINMDDQLKEAKKFTVQSCRRILETDSNTKSDSNYYIEVEPSVVRESQCSKNVINDKSFDSSHITTAYEFVTKLRDEHKVEKQMVKKVDVTAKTQEKVDSKGFRILKNQVPDLSQFTRDEILTLLKENILYSDDDLLVLNKPYGLVIHDSKTIQYPCLSLFLDDLAKDIDHKVADPKLYTVHRLDKDTTGCLLLARNDYMEQNLKSLFAQRKIIKKYWILTSSVPDPLEGVIDIPISEGSIDKKNRMVLHPQIAKDIPYQNHSKNGKRAVTSYKVISTSGNAALVEVIPETGIKHQIRVHFGFGLSCPILGDHKYSHLKKMAPQKLASDLLQKLHVRQSKVRHIPMHIHAKTIIIPGYLDGRNLHVTALLPAHMKTNMKRLKFKKRNKLL